jgi:hypothetical protein
MGEWWSMMRPLGFILLGLAAAAPVQAQRESLGIFAHWGAFQEKRPPRCFAVTEPSRRARSGEQRAFASVGFWPDKGAHGQVHFRLSAVKRPGSAVLLKIDDRTFQLLAGGSDAWAQDKRADAQIVSAMRTGVAMTVETRSGRGSVIRDNYGLAGAATAIDAAAIGCARLR